MNARMKTASRFLTVTAAALMLAATTGVLAHHSTAMFDSDNPIELSGTVNEWRFSNPHVFIMLAVEDDDGEVVVWALEGMSPNVLVRGGWRPTSLQPGDRIKATVRPLRSGEPGGNYSNLRWEDGTSIDPQAGRPD